MQGRFSDRFGSAAAFSDKEMLIQVRQRGLLEEITVSGKLPRRICTHPGCTQLAAGSTSRCGRHQPAHGWDAPRPYKRRAGRWLQQQREQLFREQPLCRMCEAAGRVTLATVRDHIVPLAEGGQDVPENTQGLCAACSDEKSRGERLRGSQRYREGRRAPVVDQWGEGAPAGAGGLPVADGQAVGDPVDGQAPQGEGVGK